jgi:histidine triad (HIT) family protein
MACAFCDIIAGASPARIVFEDDVSMAFLDARPLFPGHCLLVPRQHYEVIGELPHDLIGPLFENAQLLSGAVEAAMKAEGSFVALNNRVSQSVPHLHIHIVPRRKKDGLKGFFWPRNPYKSESEMEDVQRSIRASMQKLRTTT